MTTILEHLLSDRRKTRLLMKALKDLGLMIRATSSGEWFNIVRMS